ncbi:hypothetical protein DLJ46_32665 [Micromonospora globispora]|uniref:Uncharacterized protein n=1 Tax=Micromonospora globispora TaxID=1450148 RepID=A0A317JS60_9ACTN|nr:hypothetical protein [Micromonospora globispora]PWU43198.1 hypothetical protein DLJ46_32665 [Micromonospora globispora]
MNADGIAALTVHDCGEHVEILAAYFERSMCWTYRILLCGFCLKSWNDINEGGTELLPVPPEATFYRDPGWVVPR